VARSSPGVKRITSTLTFLAQHPHDSFTLSELCRELGLSPATAHAQLNALVADGFLLREPASRRYSLGPALVEIGVAAAARQGQVLEYARSELKGLAAELGRQCVITQVIGDRIVILDREGQLGRLGTTVEVGQRLPFEPPLGTVFLAWSDSESIEDWLRGVAPKTSAKAIAECVRQVRLVRERRYSVSLSVDSPHLPLHGGRKEDEPIGLIELLESHYFLDAIDEKGSYEVQQIAAPVFDSGGQVIVAVCVLYFGTAITGKQLRADAAEVIAAAERVTKTIHGHCPNPVE